jgi:3-oxoacyl-[acyl-carrier-protein] synthase-3
MEKVKVGIVGCGTYLPSQVMTAKEIAAKTNGIWSEEAVINKLGIRQKYIPGPEDGTQEMGAKAALNCLKNTGIDPLDIDVILCIGEEWKEYPLTTSALGHRCSKPLLHMRLGYENRSRHARGR